MNILILASIMPPEIGGPASYVPEIVRRLGKDYSFRVVTFTQNPDKIDNLPIVSISQEGNTLLRQSWLFGQILRNIFWGDLIYVMDPLVVGLPAAIAGKIFRKPVVIRFVGYQPWEETLAAGKTEKFLDDFLEKPDGGPVSQLYILATKLVFWLSSHVIVPSKYLSLVLVRHFNISLAKITHIYNAFEIPNVEPAKKSKILTAISIGRIIVRKHVDWTIEAVARYIKNTGKPMRLLVVGDGPDRPRMEKLATSLVKKYKIKPFITFLGQKSWREGLSILKSADVYLLTSVYEGLPFTVVESLVLGVPVVATDVPGTNEVAINGKTALTAKAGDIDGLVTAIEKLLNDRQLAKKLVSTGQKIIEKEFNWEQNIKKTNSLFKTLVDKD